MARLSDELDSLINGTLDRAGQVGDRLRPELVQLSKELNALVADALDQAGQVGDKLRPELAQLSLEVDGLIDEALARTGQVSERLRPDPKRAYYRTRANRRKGESNLRRSSSFFLPSFPTAI